MENIPGAYRVWKWLLLGLATVLIAPYLGQPFYLDTIMLATAVPCSIPIIGGSMPFCKEPVSNPINASKVVRSQEELVIVMGQVGNGYKLARSMVGNEYCLRDLKIRVAVSSLPRKDEIAGILESLIHLTGKVAE